MFFAIFFVFLCFFVNMLLHLCAYFHAFAKKISRWCKKNYYICILENNLIFQLLDLLIIAHTNNCLECISIFCKYLENIIYIFPLFSFIFFLLLFHLHICGIASLKIKSLEEIIETYLFNRKDAIYT